MSTTSPVPLPENPNLDQLRKQARDLQRERQQQGEQMTLSASQRDIARRHGFASWRRLVRHLEVVARYTWTPDAESEGERSADAFLRLACLTYMSEDSPDRRRRAREMLRADPALADADVHVAAACADVAALRTMLATDASLARRAGGPYGWEPLMYLAYARHDPHVSEAAVVESTRALLEHGGDPNAGALWHGLPTPFTALTGSFGEGELGPVRQPRHARSRALARVLLEAGADANDGQALYNRMFEDDDDHLVLLFEFGLGTGDGGPWRERLGATIDPPGEMVRGQLRWAAQHNQTARVRLLLDHEVDAVTPYDDGRSAIEIAAMAGNVDVVAVLEQSGLAIPTLEPDDAFVVAVLAGDREAARRADSAVIDRVRAARPGLLVWAAARGKRDAVTQLIEMGFDVDALGRSDVPREQPWETALHSAVANGDRALVELLLRAGADPTVRDARFDSRPLDWARHFGHDDLVALLTAITPETE
ncbi:MAG TPA: ankyrin repeat domain-containing protein [Acidimicrobiales bacterium]|nr:ankyrin repeat domain-containing protein [Acidimicrobiales bacterium]